MKIVSWNINGLRTKKSHLNQIISSQEADIICIQETKVTRNLLEDSIANIDGYYSFFSFSRKRSGYSGVATYCKKNVTPVAAQEGISGCLNVGSLQHDAGSVDKLAAQWEPEHLKELDSEGRCIITQHSFKDTNGSVQLLSVINVYCPRADPDKPERSDFKINFYELLRERAFLLRQAGSHVIIVGDVNTSHHKIDHCDPEDEQDFYSTPGRQFLNEFLSTADHLNADKLSATDGDCESLFKLVDAFRYFHPNLENAFTCWNTKVNARETNYGTRIDYTLCNAYFLPCVATASIHPEIYGSDHCPVSIETNESITFEPSPAVPAVCTKFFVEFSGKQKKLSSYFSKSNSENTDVKQKDAELKHPNKRKSSLQLGKPKQTKLNSFFTKPKLENISKINNENSLDKAPSTACDKVTCLDSKQPESILMKSDEGLRNNGWTFLVKTPLPPPLCPGHNEPSVLRTTKKKGPNFNKQFYSCARGAGRNGDPNARCNFFKWMKS